MKTLFLTCLVICSSAMASQNASKVFGSYSDDIVLIETKLNSAGTGFFISPELIITNRHVLIAYDQVAKKWDAPNKITLKNGKQIRSYNSIVCSMRVDLCVIKVDSQRSIVGVSKVATGKVIAGEDLFIIGHPQGILTPIITTGIISSDLFNVPGYNFKNDEIKFKGFTTNAAISPGSSGSPVLNSKGEILGVAVGILNGAQNLNIIISAEELNLFGQQIVQANTKEVFFLKEGFEVDLNQVENKYAKAPVNTNKSKSLLNLPERVSDPFIDKDELEAAPTQNLQTQSLDTAKEDCKNCILVAGVPVEKIDLSQQVSPEDVRNVLKDQVVKLKACYDSELNSLPRESALKLVGRVDVKFRIVSDGSVQDANVTSEELVSDYLSLCIKNEISKVQFPKMNPGKYIDVKQPFNLRAKDKSIQ